MTGKFFITTTQQISDWSICNKGGLSRESTVAFHYFIEMVIEMVSAHRKDSMSCVG